MEEGLRNDKEAYQDLVAEGGQPSHPITLGFDVVNHPETHEKYKDILRVWQDYAGDPFVFCRQRIEWREFRDCQESVRRFYIPRSRFHEYEDAVRESQADLGCEWDLRVLEDRNQQNRLEDWNEFRAYRYRKLEESKKRLQVAEKTFYGIWKQLEDIEPGLGGPPPDPDHPPMDGWVDGRRREIDANKRIEAAEQNLCLARSETVTGKRTQVEEAEKELQGAQEISRLQTRIIFARNPELGRQQKQTKKWALLLKWIDNQYGTIAAECEFSTSNGVKDSSGVPPLAESKGSKKAKRRLPPRQRGPARTQPVCGPSLSSGISKPSMDCGLPPSAVSLQKPAEARNPPRRSKRLAQSKGCQVGQGAGTNGLHSVRSARVTKAHAVPHTTGPDTAPRPRRAQYRGFSRCQRSLRSRRRATNGNSTLRRSRRLMALNRAAML